MGLGNICDSLSSSAVHKYVYPKLSHVNMTVNQQHMHCHKNGIVKMSAPVETCNEILKSPVAMVAVLLIVGNTYIFHSILFIFVFFQYLLLPCNTTYMKGKH